MRAAFRGWADVSARLQIQAADESLPINHGQRCSLKWLAELLPRNGAVLADEVGMGKTRIAAFLAQAVIAAGGRVAVLVPPGLGYQWHDELASARVASKPILRSLWQYLAVWDGSPTDPIWFDQQCIVISHAFTNWRLGKASDPWRWSLLPELYAHWKRETSGRVPRGYQKAEELDRHPLAPVAASIVSHLRGLPENSRAVALVRELAESTPWPSALHAGRYERHADLREWLERAVGLGLGSFDLVIVDEAHKGRGTDSAVSRLLDKVILQDEQATRRLALTATPVELGIDQWISTFGRIGVESSAASEAVRQYSDAVRAVRTSPRDPATRDAFKIAASRFEQALKPYLVRRDKREDEAVRAFKRYVGASYDAYRRSSEVVVRSSDLDNDWKQAICAAEALSHIVAHKEDAVAQRLRLMLGNGHGCAALVDQMRRETEQDGVDDPHAGTELPTATSPVAQSDAKRLDRARWWAQVALRPFGEAKSGDAALYNHPAILAATEFIEERFASGEKVLVFGRFNRPMRALVRLLNARQMLKALDSAGDGWPQQRVPDDEWPAVEAAHFQLQRPGGPRRADIDLALSKQYRDLEARRAVARGRVLAAVEAEAALLPRAARLLVARLKADEQRGVGGPSLLPALVRALAEHLPRGIDAAAPRAIAWALAEIVEAASDRDDAEDKNQEISDGTDLFKQISDRIFEEYGRAEGRFARLMNGESPPATRRLLQLAFNRSNAAPHVLVAQSAVGREGLNLHKACRTVVLLHPEWNPGVVEQQIGRVDRLGSLWEQKLREGINKRLPPDQIPRIEIRPIVFEGTYDQTNWRVLNERWRELRAQLHGVILTTDEGAGDPELAALVTELNEIAPNFSPVPRG